jgi:hypothetical protein
MLLSILIPSVPPRKKYLNKLLFEIQNQIVNNNLHDKVEVIVYVDDFEKSVGEKRNIMIEKSNGKYIVIIDDDDWISDNYCLEVSKACEEYDVDQIITNLRYFHNQKNKFVNFNISNKFKKYELVFLKYIKIILTKYEDWKNWNNELHIGNYCIIKSNNTIKRMIIFFTMFFLSKFTNGCNVYCNHHIPISKKIYKSYKFSNRPREQDIEWISYMYKNNIIKKEVRLPNVDYLYYFDAGMSINRGKWGWMSKDEKIQKLNLVMESTKDVDWEMKEINNIGIIYI